MGTVLPFTARTDSRNGVTSIALSGELDMATAPILVEQLTALERHGARAIILDLRDVRFIDSSGLHALVRAHRRSEQDGHGLMVVGASKSVRRLCEVMGTEFILDARGTAEVLGRFTGDGDRTNDRDGGSGAEPHV
jgi:anti-anti-sigma factor